MDDSGSVERHYQSLLAPVYAWMVGDLDAAFARSREVLAAAGLQRGPGLALDLGAGFGLQSIPLAEAGYQVVAIDSSRALLDELHRRAPAVRVVEDDLCRFRAHVPGPCGAIVCMGDTLTHLRSPAEVERLISDAAGALAPGGRLVLGFRDYHGPAREGAARFIPVRSDGDRILTCFLEYAPDHVQVHDLLHERQGSQWSLRVSAYRKLRLAPARVAEEMGAAGLEVSELSGPPGLATLVGVKSRRQ
jgi:SAM-dependent methyltransferase